MPVQQTMTMKYQDIHNYYDGHSQYSTSGKIFQTIDPSTSKPLATVHEASRSDIEAAIASARRAFPAWSRRPAVERCNILLRAAALLRKRNAELAEIETADTGKAFSETSTVDVISGAEVIEYFARLVGSGGLNGETTQLRDSAWVYSRKEPLGVCAGIGAWNYPLQIATWKAAPCLAAGNCMVYKSSEVTPLHSIRLAEIFTEAGVPPGVFNVVQGGGAVGAQLVSHPMIAKVSMTGQVSTGQKVASSAAQGMKYITMELGGKSPLLILPDCEVDFAVEGAMMANFFSSGQVCTNGTRVFVPKSRKTAFEKTLIRKTTQNVRMGNPMDSDVNFGPLVSRLHWEKVRDYISHGKNTDQATLLYDGATAGQSIESFATSSFKDGYWCPPHIFTDCTDDMRICTEEIFGPVMTILTYDDSKSDYLDTLLARANNTTQGLAAGVFSRDLNLAHHVVARLEAGITWINTWGESPAEMSVGGWKLSGVGVENGRKALDHWTQNKSTLVDMSGSIATAFEPLLPGTKAKL